MIVQIFQWVRQFIIPNYGNEEPGHLMSFMSIVTGGDDSLDRYSGRLIRGDYVHLFRGDIRRHIVIGRDRPIQVVHHDFLPSVEMGERIEIIDQSVAYWADFYARNTDPNTEFNQNTSFYNSDLQFPLITA